MRSVSTKWLAAFACVTGAMAQNDDAKLPETTGKAVVERVCTPCHGLENVVGARMTRTRWSAVVDDMVSRGATASDAEIEQIVTYLATNFGAPNPTRQAKP